MRKRDLADGIVGPRLEETLDQIFCMQGMTTAEKVDFLMSRNRELRAENHHLHAEIAELEGTIECLKGLAEANYERCYTCEAMLDCDECLRADASHKELRGLQAENAKLRELARDMLHWMPCQRPCQRCERYRYPEGCEFEIRRRKLGVEVEQ